MILLLALLFCLGFFSAAETALTSLRRIHIGDTKQKNKKEIVLLNLWLKNPNELLVTLLFGKTISYLLLISTTTLLLENYYFSNFGKTLNSYIYMLISFTVIGAFMLIFTEIILR